MAPRRKRGPVAFRPRLLVGLALSLLSLKRSRKLPDCPIVNRIGTYTGNSGVRFGENQP